MSPRPLSRPGILRLCDPFRAAGWWYLVGDRNFELRCGCGVTQRADALRARDDRGVTLYDCAHCGISLIGVAADDRAPAASAVEAMWPSSDEGHRMCGFVFASKVDMAMWPPGATEPYMQIPARPGFFSSRGFE